MLNRNISLTVANTIYFGTIPIPASTIFLMRSHIFGLVNLKPFRPGHVMVCSRRIVASLSELTETETLEFWCTVQEVADVLEQIYKVL